MDPMICDLWSSHIWLLVLICFCGFQQSSGFFVDYTENTELIQQRAGYDVKLQCNLKGLVDESMLDDIKIHWYFKQCSENNCHQLESVDEWTALPCEPSLCRPELWLRNVTERYSGLYKCSINPHIWDKAQTVDVQLVRTYQLDVKNTSLAAPEFVDSYPNNKTVLVGSQVVFQCRVHSEEHPTIKWFRRQTFVGTQSTGESSSTASTTSNFSTHIVRYNGRTYELLSTDPEKLMAPQMYLSKLILDGVRFRDAGHYACVAISYRGHKIREAFLEVLPVQDDSDLEKEYWSDYDGSDEGVPTSDPREFLLLFLMPLGLALLPLTVWFSYVLYKRCSGGHGDCQRMDSDEDLEAERCVLGGN
ncbi:cell adhesion molecule-related/down-regulated by oncogenes [Drosophila ficusphila]|uniref:cell adhesion molecule-related/down-regulated by oncogenes n=1 Tax=Drosophila ficusphila TaxID=30025 RepID=UPI0007E85DF7|nr:cell adhesion molecule-related/down-regulated by oncogenes [Drosophila ficusphila]